MGNIAITQLQKSSFKKVGFLSKAEIDFAVILDSAEIDLFKHY